jgi:hypothetical protein
MMIVVPPLWNLVAYQVNAQLPKTPNVPGSPAPQASDAAGRWAAVTEVSHWRSCLRTKEIG